MAVVENPVIEVHDLTVSYHKKPVLWSVDFDIPQGSIVGIIGPNGAGKSTLIKAMMDLVSISSGYVKLFDKELDEVRHRISYVPQRESVDWDFPASVLDIALMGLYKQKGIFKRFTSKDKEKAMDALKLVKMEHLADRQIAQLSGGQQQRAFLARSLAQDADLYLMDEPFAGVDAATESSIIDLLRQMKTEGKTVLVIHHDLQTADDYFDWIVLLNKHLVACGPVEEVFTRELLQKTYGGQLSILSAVGDLIAEKEFPKREK